VVKTSPIETRMAFAWVRSMSRYSQGVSARKLVNRSCSPSVRPPAATTSSATYWRVFSPVSPRSSTTTLNPPAVPSPSSGGAPKTLITPSLISPCRASRSRAAMASPDSSAAVRLSKSSSMTNMAPKLGALALSSSDWPATATVFLTPGVFRAICSIRRITRSVRCSEEESGSWTLTSR
jgi:hypothetical protein